MPLQIRRYGSPSAGGSLSVVSSFAQTKIVLNLSKRQRCGDRLDSPFMYRIYDVDLFFLLSSLTLCFFQRKKMIFLFIFQSIRWWVLNACCHQRMGKKEATISKKKCDIFDSTVSVWREAAKYIFKLNLSNNFHATATPNDVKSVKTRFMAHHFHWIHYSLYSRAAITSTAAPHRPMGSFRIFRNLWSICDSWHNIIHVRRNKTSRACRRRRCNHLGHTCVRPTEHEKLSSYCIQFVNILFCRSIHRKRIEFRLSFSARHPWPEPTLTTDQ